MIKITKTLPTIFGFNIENIKQKIDYLISLGYTKEEVIKITKSCPPIYGSSIENIKQKMEFYDSIYMHDLAVIKPIYLMQSVELSYARYMFYKEIGIEVGMKNYIRMFVNNKIFERQYGITKIELLEKYNYKKYIEENNKILKFNNII